MLHFWDGACSNVACFVIAVAKALASNPSAGAHEGAGIVPLGAVPGAFSGKFSLPNLILLHEKFLMIRSPMLLFRFLFFPPPRCLSSSPGGMTMVVVVGFLGGDFGEKGRIEGIVNDHIKNFVKANKADVDHRAILIFFHSPSQR